MGGAPSGETRRFVPPDGFFAEAFFLSSTPSLEMGETSEMSEPFIFRASLPGSSTMGISPKSASISPACSRSSVTDPPAMLRVESDPPVFRRSLIGDRSRSSIPLGMSPDISCESETLAGSVGAPLASELVLSLLALLLPVLGGVIVDDLPAGTVELLCKPVA